MLDITIAIGASSKTLVNVAIVTKAKEITSKSLYNFTKAKNENIKIITSVNLMTGIINFPKTKLKSVLRM